VRVGPPGAVFIRLAHSVRGLQVYPDIHYLPPGGLSSHQVDIAEDPGYGSLPPYTRCPSASAVATFVSKDARGNTNAWQVLTFNAYS
jgi:hypothetical protein